MTRFCQGSEAEAPHRVLIHPGAMQLTRTVGARDRARLFEKLMIPPFAAAKSWAESLAIPERA